MNASRAAPTHPPSPTPAVPADTRLPRRAVLGFLMLTSFGTGVVLSILGPTVPAIAARLSAPEAALGIVFTANFLAATVTTAASGALVGRVSGRLLIPCGLAAMAAGLLGEGTAAALPLVAAGGLVVGVGTGIINVAVNAVTMRLFATRRGIVLTWLNVSFGAGAFCTPLLAGLALTRLGGYTPAYLAGAAVLALPALPLYWGLPESDAGSDTRAAPRTARGAGGFSLLRDRALRLLMALAGLYLGAEIGFGGWVVAIIARMTHVLPALLAPAASVFWVCLAVGGVPTVVLLRRGIAPRRLIQGGALAAAAAAALLFATGGTVALAVACCALLGLALAPILPMVTALAAGQEDANGVVGPRVAAIFTAGQVGGATLPALQGLLLGAGPGFALSLTAICAVGMAALATMLGED